MAQLALGRTFLSKYAKLDSVVRNRVDEALGKVRDLSLVDLHRMKGIHLEKYVNQRDPRARTMRFGDNHRGIAMVDPAREFIVLVDVMTHDDADRWMVRNKFSVNEATGALEILDVASFEAAIAEVDAEAQPSDTQLFSHRSDREFRQLGVSADLLPVLRALTDEEQLLGLMSFLPEGQQEALSRLITEDTVEAIYAEIAGKTVTEEIDTEDLVAAAESVASQGLFHIVEDEEELAKMLAEPLAQWRTYLHQSQRAIAYRPVFNGPARVTGGAGTGKTVVAMHRVLALGTALEDRSGTPILFTTFTRNLAQSVERDLVLLGGSDLSDVVDVLNVDKLAYRIVEDAEGAQPKIVRPEQLDDFWERAVDEVGTNLTPAFLSQEWEQVILAQDIQSRDQYFAAPRAGRGVRLDRRQRAAAWKVVERVSELLASKGQRTYLQLSRDAVGYLRQEPSKPYRHIVVDEGQDLHEVQWRLLRNAVPEGPNDLFIVGDAHQRIYDRRSSLGRVGINIVGRSSRLRINYRTTHEILGWSLGVLGIGEFDDLDSGVESQTLGEYHSFLHGPAPTLAGFASADAQLAGVAEQVDRWIKAGVEPEDIAVASRTKKGDRVLQAALSARRIRSHVLGNELVEATGVAIGTMHRLKGLEYRCVAVFDVDDLHMPHHRAVTPASVDPLQHETDLRMERCLLYVACTRAREDLWVGWAGNPSPFLPLA